MVFSLSLGAHSSRGLGHRPLTAVTGVRIPYALPLDSKDFRGFRWHASKVPLVYFRSKFDLREGRFGPVSTSIESSSPSSPNLGKVAPKVAIGNVELSPVFAGDIGNIAKFAMSTRAREGFAIPLLRSSGADRASVTWQGDAYAVAPLELHFEA